MPSTQLKAIAHDGYRWLLVRTFERDPGGDGDVVYVRQPLSASGGVEFEEVSGTDVPWVVRYGIAEQLIAG